MTRSSSAPEPRARGGAPRIAVLLPYVWSVRNVVYAGVLDRLAAAGCEVHLILRHGQPSPDDPAAPSLAAAAGVHALIQPPERPVRAKALLDAVIRSGFNRRNRIGSYAIYRRWFERDWSAAQRARGALIEMLGAAAQRPRLFESLCGLAERRYRRSHDLAGVRAQLAEIAPDVVWSTFCVAPQEYPYYLAARDAGIPVVTSILSFDNLTSRSAIPDYDHYYVWHEGMRAQLLRFYPHVSPDRVTITGTPQFDFHRDPAFLPERGDTLAMLGLPSDARYVLYAASFVGLAPEEPLLVRALAQRMRENPALRDVWMVVRIHPLERPERWRPATDASPRVVVQTAWERPPDADGWTLSSPSDQTRLIGTLAHAEACVNVASTMSLDAAILDRPVIGIDFSGEPEAPAGVMYTEYGVDHYAPLVARGGLRVAESWSELLALMEAALTDPARDRAQRADMVRHECGMVDGHAADRLAAALLRRVGITSAAEPAGPAGRARHRALADIGSGDDR